MTNNYEVDISNRAALCADGAQLNELSKMKLKLSALSQLKSATV